MAAVVEHDNNDPFLLFLGLAYCRLPKYFTFEKERKRKQSEQKRGISSANTAALLCDHHNRKQPQQSTNSHNQITETQLLWSAIGREKYRRTVDHRTQVTIEGCRRGENISRQNSTFTTSSHSLPPRKNHRDSTLPVYC